jgi:anthranilate synthase component 1
MRAPIRELAGARDLLPLAAAFPDRYPCLLESVASGPERARWDLLLRHEGAVLRADDPADPRPFLDRLDEAWRAVRDEPAASALPFSGGFAVFLSYELAAECEPSLRAPPPPDGVPRALALRCPAAILVDREAGRTLLVAEAGHEHLLDAMAADLDGAPAAAGDFALDGAPVEDDPARFLDGVARVHHYLRAGDLFQCNLSRGWSARLAPGSDAGALYRALRAANPAPFAGMFRHEGLAVLSSSPERLLAVRGRRAETRPIAGTRPRAASGVDDAARVRELIGSPKERAEHIMLIDLERNDLGRVCEPGSVVVEELMSVESYAHVHHIVSNVAGRLRADVTPGQAIRAVFPGGTITGCPKVRCMQVIAELEGEGRGPYTGAMGWLDRSGDLDLNILIRTIWVHEGVARWRAGSGIVADSDPPRELDETRAKARGLLRALGHDA